MHRDIWYEIAKWLDFRTAQSLMCTCKDAASIRVQKETQSLIILFKKLRCNQDVAHYYNLILYQSLILDESSPNILRRLITETPLNLLTCKLEGQMEEYIGRRIKMCKSRICGNIGKANVCKKKVEGIIATMRKEGNYSVAYILLLDFHEGLSFFNTSIPDFIMGDLVESIENCVCEFGIFPSYLSNIEPFFIT